jgi:hypothetical protein
MSIVQRRARRAVSTGIAALTLVGASMLLAGDASDRLFPAGAHKFFAALPLVLIAVAQVVDQAGRRASRAEWVKTSLLAFGFLFWAANQLCPDFRLAMVLNDVAIAAFILDAFVVIIGWPPGSERSESETEHAVRLRAFTADGEPPTDAAAERT